MTNVFYNFPYVSVEDLSVEVNGDEYNLLSNQNNTEFESDLTSLFNTDLLGSDLNKDLYCVPAEYLGKRKRVSNENKCSSTASINCATEPNEFDEYFGPKYASSNKEQDRIQA